uniref:Putative triabin n=1 Tax=Panstrongylus megistus TaxID=65343 RepID=A0A069DXA4_9HEMI
MKTIIAVTFLGIVMNAFARDSIQKKKCHYGAMSGFNSTRYLQMPLTYETHAEKATFPVVCRVTETTQISGGKVDTITYEYYQSSLCGQQTTSLCCSRIAYYSEGNCNANVDDMKDGQYSEVCRITYDTYYDDSEILKDVEFTVYTSVIDTDYKNYAIVYRCIDNGQYDNILVLKTNKDAKNDLVRKALRKKGMKLKTFSSRTDNAYCDKK